MIAFDAGALIVAVLANIVVIALVVLLVLALLRRRTHEGRVSVALSWRGNGHTDEPESVTDQAPPPAGN